jgi:hypothetical protein
MLFFVMVGKSCHPVAEEMCDIHTQIMNIHVRPDTIKEF